MADNVTLSSGSGGDTIAADEVGAVKYQVVKLDVGGDGLAAPLSNSNPVPISDAGGTLTVDGTVTANLSATDNAVLDSIQAAVEIIDNAISGTEMQVDVVAALPAGTNNIGDVDVLSVVPGTGATALGKAIDSVGGATDTGVALLAIRDDALTTLTPVDGDYVALRVSSTGALHVTGSAGTTQYAEDAVAASGDSLCVVGAVRRDTAASSSVTDGDYVTLNTNATGALRVTIDSITGSQTDDAAFTPGTSTVSIVGAEFDDTTPDSVDEGDGGALRMSANRNLYSTIRDAAGNERGANVNASNQLTITGPVTNAGTFAVQVDGAALTALQLIDNPVFADDAAFTLTSSSVSVAGAIRDDALATLTAIEGDAVPLRVSSTGALHVTGGGGGTEYTVDAAAPAAPTGATFVMERDDAVSALTEIEGDWTNPRSNANGAMWVAVDGSVAVTNSGITTIAGAVAGTEMQVDVLTMPTVTVNSHAVTNAGTFAVQAASAGIAADDAATSGNPVLVAGVAVETDGTDPTTVSAEGDAAYLRTDRARRLLVSEHHPRSFFTSADYATAQTNASVQAAPGAGLSLYITDIVISNGAVAGNVTLLDGSAGTVKFEIYPAINGGVSISLRQPIRLTANTALCITSTTVTTHSVNIGGYTAP